MKEILEAMRAQSWEQVKAHLKTIQMVDYAPDDGKMLSRVEWDEKCQKRREIFDAFIAEVESNEYWR